MTKETKVALLTVGAALIAFFGYRLLKGNDFFKSTTSYYTQYKEVNGLMESNAVLVNGYPVGRVAKITVVEQNGKVELYVKLEIDEDILIGDQSIAYITDTDILGGKGIRLDLKGTNYLEDGGLIKGALDEGLVATLTGEARPLIERSKPLLDTLGTTLSVYTEMGRKYSSTAVQADRTLAELSILLAENRLMLTRTLRNTAIFTAELAEMEGELVSLTRKLNGLADSLNQINFAQMNNTVSNLNNLVLDMNKASNALTSDTGAIGALLYDRSLYNNLDQSAIDLDRLLVDLREDPDRYVSLRFSLFGGKDKDKDKDKDEKKEFRKYSDAELGRAPKKETQVKTSPNMDTITIIPGDNTRVKIDEEKDEVDVEVEETDE